jgi:hypothetical protein
VSVDGENSVGSAISAKSNNLSTSARATVCERVTIENRVAIKKANTEKRVFIVQPYHEHLFLLDIANAHSISADLYLVVAVPQANIAGQRMHGKIHHAQLSLLICI